MLDSEILDLFGPTIQRVIPLSDENGGYCLDTPRQGWFGRAWGRATVLCVVALLTTPLWA